MREGTAATHLIGTHTLGWQHAESRVLPPPGHNGRPPQHVTPSQQQYDAFRGAGTTKVEPSIDGTEILHELGAEVTADQLNFMGVGSFQG